MNLWLSVTIGHVQSNDWLCLNSISSSPWLDLTISSLMNQSNYFQSYHLTQLSPTPYFLFLYIIYTLKLFPSPSEWKMAKDAPNHIPENMIG